MKPSRNPLKQKLFENQLLVTTRNTQLVQKALNNLMEIAQVEVRFYNVSDMFRVDNLIQISKLIDLNIFFSFSYF